MIFSDRIRSTVYTSGFLTGCIAPFVVLNVVDVLDTIEEDPSPE
jgi:hypothetical protein